MLLIKHSLFVSCLLIIYADALSCRSKYGPTDEELKRIFNDCLREQEEENDRNNRYSSERDRMERSYNHKNDYERNRENTNRDQDNDRENYNSERSNSRDNGRNGRTESDKNNEDRRNNRNDNSNNTEAGKGRNEVKIRQDDFLQSEEYVNQNYYSSPNRRYKRERKVEMNSGQRSQYNPHTQRYNENNKNHSDEGNFTENSNNVACVLHCFLEKLQMTGDDGMPDRYLITHALTKDETNEDLRDFLQESIEECFQILVNENTDDKCEFSKNLWICLTEKGKASCEDWPKKSSFMI